MILEFHAFRQVEYVKQEDSILAALEGLENSELKGNFILCCIHGALVAFNDETLELAKKYLVDDGGVVAIDIAGAGALYPAEGYRL